MSAVVREMRCRADEVFAVVADPTSYPRWLVGARRVESVDPSWPAVGSEFAHEVGVGPVEVHDTTSVRAIRPGRMLSLIVHARPFLEADVRIEVDEREGRSLVTMSERARGRFRALGWVIAPLVTLRNRRSLRLLAELVEGRPDR